ncbi:MAG: hypothetical protein KDJ97_09860 [Anaerolineae bacterium]|nr:hypothetical protein [Anaerolineae bacterium]
MTKNLIFIVFCQQSESDKCFKKEFRFGDGNLDPGNYEPLRGFINELKKDQGKNKISQNHPFTLKDFDVYAADDSPGETIVQPNESETFGLGVPEDGYPTYGRPMYVGWAVSDNDIIADGRNTLSWDEMKAFNAFLKEILQTNVNGAPYYDASSRVKFSWIVIRLSEDGIPEGKKLADLIAAGSSGG